MRVKIGTAADIASSGRKMVSIDGVEIGVFHVEGQLVGWRNQCPHQGGPVCQGRLFKPVVEKLDDVGRTISRDFHATDMNIVCPWHGMEFDLKTGRFVGNKDMSLQSAKVEVVDGDVYVTA